MGWEEVEPNHWVLAVDDDWTFEIRLTGDVAFGFWRVRGELVAGAGLGRADPLRRLLRRAPAASGVLN